MRYSFYQENGTAICVICFESCNSSRNNEDIVRHLLLHDERDLAVCGYAGFFLKRIDEENLADQKPFMQQLKDKYLLRAR